MDIIYQNYMALIHFTMYIDIKHIKENNPFESVHLLNHFLGKLESKINRSGLNFISSDQIIYWLLEMTDHNRKDLFKYIIKYHSNKY
jgi:hypothetical protein